MSKVFGIGLALVLVLVGAIVGGLTISSENGDGAGRFPPSITLERPAFLALAANSTTFPTNESGIAAYVQLDSINISQFTAALLYYSQISETNENYVIGTIKVNNIAHLGDVGPVSATVYPHLYIGRDGWMVAYFLNTEPASYIAQWKNYTPGGSLDTTLKDAIDYMCGNIGANYSLPVRYYDFEFPGANEMTIVAEVLPNSYHPNDFSVTIPGTLYEASYYLCAYLDSYGYYVTVNLIVDGKTAFTYTAGTTFCITQYGYYGSANNTTEYFQVNVPHLVSLTERCDGGACKGVADATTIFIYQS